MLSNKPSTGFHNVLGFNLGIPAFLLLMCVTIFGAVDSRLGLPESLKEVLGLEYTPFSIAVYGEITFENAASPPVHIYNADVCADGTNCVTSNGSDADYSVTVSNGYHTVCASKTPSIDYNSSYVTSYDAALIAAHASGSPLLATTPLRMAADVTGNGTISSTDASRVSNYVVQLTPYGLTGSWAFWHEGNSAPWPPWTIGDEVPSCYEDINVSGGYAADFTGILYGDVDGNWDGTDPRPGPGANTMTVALPRMTASGREIVVPVNVQGISDQGIIAYQLNLRYDPAVLKPQRDLVSLVGTASDEFNYSVNAGEPGLIRLAVYGIRPVTNDGVLLNLKFTSVGEQGSTSALALERVLLNRSRPGTITDGRVVISSANSTKTATD